MSPRYLFPCPNCDHKFELVSKQAGQELACPDCSNAVEAPKLGTLKQLELAESGQEGGDHSSGGRNGNSGSLKNLVFVGGLALAIIAGAAGLALYQYAKSKVVEFDLAGNLEEYETWIDEQPPTGVLGSYVEMGTSQGLPEWVEQPHVGENKQAAILKKVAYGLFGLASLGLLTLIGSFMMRT